MKLFEFLIFFLLFLNIVVVVCALGKFLFPFTKFIYEVYFRLKEGMDPSDVSDSGL